MDFRGTSFLSTFLSHYHGCLALSGRLSNQLGCSRSVQLIEKCVGGEASEGNQVPFVRVVEEALSEEAKEKRRVTSVSLGAGSGVKGKGRVSN